MADLLQFICENSDHSQIPAVLSRFVKEKNSVVDINFLESLKLVLSTLERSQNLSADLAIEVVKEICWPVVYRSYPSKDANKFSGNHRKMLHICYDIVAFCFSAFPTIVQSVICGKSLQIFDRYLAEKSFAEENARDVSVTLDLIGNFAKSDALNASKDANLMLGEQGDELFQKMLTLLPHTSDDLCAKLTSLVLPSFLEFKTVHRCEAVWSVVKQIFQSKGAGCRFGTFDQTYAILCGLADFFFSRDNYNLFDQPEFWEIIQKGLVINQPLTRKRTMYLLKRALDLLDKLPWDLSVMSERGYNIFYWSSDHKETLRGIWQDYVLLMETFDEKQAHIIKPVLARISSITDATKEKTNGLRLLDTSWLLTLYHRAAQHDNRFICRWAILDFLHVDLDCSSPLLSTCYWGFLFGPLMSFVGEYAIYARTDDEARGDPPAVGSAVVRFFTEFASRLSVKERPSFCAELLSAVVRQEFTQVPLVFMTQMLANLPPTHSWDSDSLMSIRNIFPLFRAYNPHMSSAIQSFLVKAVIKQTDPKRVQWSDIGDFVSLLSKDDCLRRGSNLWEATVCWIWTICDIISSKGSKQSGMNPEKPGSSNLFDHLRERVHAFLSNETPELSGEEQQVRSVVRLVVIGCDAQLKFSKSLTSEQLVKETFHQIVGVLQHAHSHVYASEVRTARAAMILAGVLHHLNNTSQQAAQGSNEPLEKIQKIDHSLEIMASLLRSAGPDILDLLLRKLTAAPIDFTCAGSSFPFLDLSSELCKFMTSSVQGQVLEGYNHFIENLVERSKEVIQRKQLDRRQLSLSDWCSFALSMRCLSFCCSALNSDPYTNSTFVRKRILEAIAGFDLCSEFPTPQAMYPPDPADVITKVETRASMKKGWGRLVSEFLEAQWSSIGFFLEELDRCEDLDEKFENFLEALPEAALEALSLGSGQAVIPVIRCVRLLTPRMLITDVALCRQSLESVWWTFQDRPKGDHIYFWRTLKEAARAFCNPCLLTLPSEHPVSTLVRNYWAELSALADDRAGVMNHVVGPLCQFWCSVPNSDQSCKAATLELTKEDRKKSIEVHLDFITEACLFGPREKKTLRVTNYVLEYVYGLAKQRVICPINVDELRDDTRVRVNAINTLVTLNPRQALDRRLLETIVHALIAKNAELGEEKRKSSINSYYHRKKHRVWQAILVALSSLLETDTAESFAREVLDGIFNAVLSDNQVSVRNYLQWGMVLIFGRFPGLRALLWEQLKYDVSRRAGSVSSFLVVAAQVGEFSLQNSDSQAAYFRHAFPVVLPWALTSHVMVQAYAQVTLQKMWLTCQRQNLSDVISDHAIIKSCVNFLEANNEGLRQKTRVLADFFFLDVHPYRDFSMQTLFETLPRLSDVTDEEWISPNVFIQGPLGVCAWKSSSAEKAPCRLPLLNPDDTRMGQMENAPSFNYEENIGDQIRRRLLGDPINKQSMREAIGNGNEGIWGSHTGDVQKKITPWKVIPPDEEMIFELQEQRLANLRKNAAGQLIVVASLIDKAPNLGGLCRTCEIFGVQTLVLSNTHVVEDAQFKSLSVSAAKWMNIQEVRMSELKSYLESMRHEGYTLVGVEQTANSKSLTQYRFPEKSLLLLGHEKEGIPVELIQILDVCVEIPQVGIIRSLNVHVSGALLVWEYTRQRVLAGAP